MTDLEISSSLGSSTKSQTFMLLYLNDKTFTGSNEYTAKLANNVLKACQTKDSIQLVLVQEKDLLVLYRCTVPLYCTAVLYRCTVPLDCTAGLYRCTVPLYCTAVLYRCTAELCHICCEVYDEYLLYHYLL